MQISGAFAGGTEAAAPRLILRSDQKNFDRDLFDAAGWVDRVALSKAGPGHPAFIADRACVRARVPRETGGSVAS
jgi:hypothetical protein